MNFRQAKDATFECSWKCFTPDQILPNHTINKKLKFHDRFLKNYKNNYVNMKPLKVVLPAIRRALRSKPENLANDHNDQIKRTLFLGRHSDIVKRLDKLMKGKALRKHSLHEKTAASVLLKLFISPLFYLDGGWNINSTCQT